MAGSTTMIKLLEDVDPLKAQLMGLRRARKRGDMEQVHNYMLGPLTTRPILYEIVSKGV